MQRALRAVRRYRQRRHHRLERSVLLHGARASEAAVRLHDHALTMLMHLQEGNECVFFSSSYSQCKPCNGVYEQWCVTMCRHCETATSTEKTNTPPSGGTIPGTDVPWQGHGRASCCAAGSSCRYVNTNYYQCKPNNV